VYVDDAHELGRAAKRKRFLQLAKSPKYKGPIIVAEGDSWFEYPFAKDLINFAGEEYAVLSLARAGDTWGDILDQDRNPPKRYSDGTLKGLIHNLEKPEIRKFNFVMLSAGGNDLIGQLTSCVHKFDPHRPEDEYIKHDGVGAFDAVLGLVLKDYKDCLKSITDLGATVILHTYDYPNPTSGGQYIGYPLEHVLHFPNGSVGLMRRVVNQMIDLFHDGLAAIADASKGKAILIDLRNTIGTKDYLNGPDGRLWQDEMHGNRAGFKLLWQRMDKDLRKIF
jgi:hypothetical protein